MGIPIDEPVQIEQPGALTGEKVSVGSQDHLPGVSHDNVLNQLSGGTNDYVPLEDILACADAQYGKNHLVPNGATVSPKDAILSGPLGWIWGPATPAMNNAPVCEDMAALGGLGSVNNSSEKVSDVEDSVAKEIENRRKLRKVTAFGAFALITTDILGPFNTGYAYSQVGFVPGALLYFFMGVAAWYAGNILSVLYLRTDSDRYPIRNYGQLTGRILGSVGRVIADTLMIIQLVVNCGTLILSNGQSLAQIVAGPSGNGHLCFIVCIIIFFLINWLLSPLRSLQGLTHFSKVAVFLNCTLIILTIAFLATNPPNYAAAEASFGVTEGPVVASAFVTLALEARVNGIMNMVFAYGGAMIFVDFLSEMRQPWSFWKSMSFAQMLIGTLYTIFGAVTYYLDGQFTESLAYYGVSKYSEQTVGNVIAVITGVIAALLYGNISAKLCYVTIVQRWCGGPALMTRSGFWCWIMVNAVFWPLAFIVGAAIPQVQTISGLVAAVCILQFSYTFPFLLKWAFDLQVYAMHADPTHTVGQKPMRKDAGLGRLMRGWGGGSIGQFLLNWAHFLLFLASLSLACLGMYGSGTAIKDTFEVAAATSFGCTAPA